MFRTMPVVPGAAEALWRLSDAGVWIRLITHRLYTNWGHAVAVADTVAWLDEHAIPYRDLCFLGDKPQVEADAYVDDAPHNVISLRGTGAAVLVFSQPYNAELDGPRAAGWAEVEEWVLQRMASGGRPVQPPMPFAGDVGQRLHPRLPTDAPSPTARARDLIRSRGTRAHSRPLYGAPMAGVGRLFSAIAVTAAALRPARRSRCGPCSTACAIPSGRGRCRAVVRSSGWSRSCSGSSRSSVVW